MNAPHRWSGATVDLASVPAGGMSVRLSAGVEERRAIADRLQLPDVEDCTAKLTLRPDSGRGGMSVEGQLSARLVRRCVVTDDRMAETVDRTVECLIVAEEPADRDDGADDQDYEIAPDGRVDLAELAVQFLAVSMAAYPRGPDADRALAAFRTEGDSAAGDPDNPFAGLGARLGLQPERPKGASGEDDGS